MNISNFNFSNFNINKDLKTGSKQALSRKELTSDCFQRTTSPSFGIGEFNLFGRFIDILKRHNDEIRIEGIIITFSDKSMEHIYKRLRHHRIEEIIGNSPRTKPVIPLLKAGGINTIFEIEQFVKNYNKAANQSEKGYKGQSIEAIEINGKLARKDDLANFCDILLYIYNEEKEQENPNFNKLNEYTTFLRQIGIKNFSEFDEKFAHIKSQFNNFENISDKAEAIEYLITSYPKKIKFLSDIIQKHPTLKNKDAEKIYTEIYDIVDFYYEKNSEESLDDLDSIIDIALSHGKLKSQALKQLELSKKVLKTPEEKIEFYHFLKDCDVSINDFNTIASKSFIENPKHDLLDKLINKKYLTQCIEDIKNCTKEDASDFYRRFNDVINETYTEESGNLEYLKIIIELVEKYKIKNSDGILKLYNDVTKQNRKSITQAELCDFIDLFRYTESKNIIEEAKSKKTKAIDLLISEKQEFERIKPEIENYLNSDNSSFFAGETALSIYKKYKKLFNTANESTTTILEVISGKDIEAATKQKQIQEAITTFSKYFSDKNDILKFLNTNQISLNSNRRETEYKDNCIEILDSIFDEKEPELSKERIQYIANSGFLLKSKSKLNELLERAQDLELRKNILILIADKKVSSLNQLEKFFKEYRSDNNADKLLLEFLSKLPQDITFSECYEILNILQNKLKNLNLPIQINAENMQNIDIGSYKNSKKIQTQEITELLNTMLAPEAGKNFITTLPASTQKTETKICANKIAKELAFNSENSKESYQNLTRLLGIDKKSLNLLDNISPYLYIEAILEKLPPEFIAFVNSNDWLIYDENTEIPNISLHARLRAIDRFALNGAESINELYTKETKEKLKSLFKTVYTQTPTDIKGTEQTKQIVTNNIHNSIVIETVFSQKGKMVTIVPKRK